MTSRALQLAACAMVAAIALAVVLSRRGEAPAGSPAWAPARGPKVVRVEGAPGSWRLTVDGAPFFVKGMGLPAEAVAPERLARSMADVRSLGANTVRIWGTDSSAPTLLDAAAAEGLGVIVGFWLGHDVDYVADAARRERTRREICASVDALKNHPAVLMWSLGNEVILGLQNHFPDPEPQRVAYARHVDELARAIRERDPSHPVTSTDTRHALRTYKEHAPSLDLYAANDFGGLPDFFDATRALKLERPYLITEFGPPGDWEVPRDENGLAVEPGDTAKAEAYRSGWTAHIAARAGHALGGVAFLYGAKEDFGGVWYSNVTDGCRRAAYYAQKEMFTGASVAGNRPPRIDAVEIRPPGGVTLGEVFTLRARAADPDGDPIRYAVKVCGTDGGDPALVLAEASEVRPGELEVVAPRAPGAWKLYLYAYDGKGNVAIAPRSLRVAARPPRARAEPPPDFGPHVRMFDPSMPASSIQAEVDRIHASQKDAEFGAGRHALLFKPGAYAVDLPVGFYTEVTGLGATPEAVSITGRLHSGAHLPKDNVTNEFWRGVSNFSIRPSGGTVQWAVSQAAWFRQMHVRGSVALHQNHGWASGGWMANSRVDGNVDSGPQQQWISRNTEWKSWTGALWNMVFVGVKNAPEGTWPDPPYTRIDVAPVVREKPFLHVGADGSLRVRRPSLKLRSAGYDWGDGAVPGEDVPIERFHVARAGVDGADRLNAALSEGKHLILTPGIYGLDGPIRIARAGTIVLGLGFATLRPDTGREAMTIADVDGVTVAGVLFDAGGARSPALLEVGTRGSRERHASNPIALHDVIFRVGGAGPGSAATCLRIHASDTIVDHTWIWRADHGAGVGWESNPADTGLEVDGDDVTIYGLFVEHFQRHQTIWNGNGGRVYLYQSEIPYDPPDQASWTSPGRGKGWASYKVSGAVTAHEAWGLGVYSMFSNPGISLARAIEVPNAPGVKLHNMITVGIGANGGIESVVNDAGGATAPHCKVIPRVASFP